MSDERSESQVHVEGDGNVVGDDSVSQVVKVEGGTASDIIQVAGDYHAAPATLWSSVGAFVARRWPVLLALLAVDGLLLVLYLNLRDRYLVKPAVGAGAPALAALAVLGWFGLASQRWRRAWLWGVSAGLSVLFVAVLAWQAGQVIWPPQFAPQDFGIAVARFAEGAEFRGTRLARDVTDLVYRGLADAIQGNPDWQEVGVVPVGLVSSEDQARRWGRRVRADLVVWGQVVVVREGVVSVRFEILENPDRASSPASPLVLPAVARFTQSGFPEVVDAPLREDEIKELVLQQSQSITAFSLGLAAYFNRDYATAIDQFRTAAQAIDPALAGCEAEDDRLGLIYFYLGRSYQRLGELETGAEWLGQAGGCVPGDPAIPLSLAYGANSLGRKDEARERAQGAIDLADGLLRLDPDDDVVAYDRALAYQLLGQHLRAAEEFDAILEVEPGFYVAHLSAGLAYLEAGDTAQAIERFQTAVAQAEGQGADSSWAHLFLADACSRAGEFERAAVSYRRAVELAPDVDWMYYRQGVFYAGLGNVDAARQAYERMLEVTYDEAWAHAVLGAFYRAHALPDEAIAHYRFVRRKRPDDTLSQIYLAELYTETGQHELAVQIYEEALARTPDLQYGRVSFGVALMGLGDYPAAIAQFTTALELDPDDGVARFDRARAYEADGQLARALEEYQAILDAPPDRYSDIVRQAAQEQMAALATPTPTATPAPEPTPMATATALAPTLTATPAPEPMPTPTATALAPAPTATPAPEPTATPTHTPTPPHSHTPTPTAVAGATQTPAAQAVQPELVSPAQGMMYKNPLAFQWRGALNPGEVYQVTVYHPESGRTIQSEPLATPAWTADLPVERVGEWRWRVSVVRGESAVVTSAEWMFWFNPWDTPTPTLTPSPTDAATPIPPDTPTITPSPTATATPIPPDTPTITPLPGPTATPIPPDTPTCTATSPPSGPTPTRVLVPPDTPTPTCTPSPTRRPTRPPG